MEYIRCVFLLHIISFDEHRVEQYNQISCCTTLIFFFVHVQNHVASSLLSNTAEIKYTMFN